MNYIYSEFQAREGDIVEVTLDRRANVRLLDSANYNSFKSGQRHRYIGGQVLCSPLRLPVPSSGTWYTVIDFGGGSGTIRCGVRVLTPR